MRRRELIVGLLGAAASSRYAIAQRAGSPRQIDILFGRSPNDAEGRLQAQAFENELASRGWTASAALKISPYWAGGDPARFAALAKSIASEKPDLIVCHTTAAARAISNETNTIPVIFIAVTDPVSNGFVKSLARPEGNMTGLIDLEPSLGGKWVELLKELVPDLATIGCLINPKTAAGGGSYYLNAVQSGALASGLKFETLYVESADEISRCLAAFAELPRGGVIVMPDIFNGLNKSLIVSSVARLRLPTVYAFRLFVLDGGLASYGVSLTDLFRRAAIYADRILRGARPADLPVELPTKFEMTINQATAKALSISISSSLLSRADEVIE
ncbi:ABC transporter substrate-binding protein [Bradyrhizobium manausense]|uniref:ABC transporter substrate-binding protein n=1 Tax=Bradyrhizobium manausense TaxID=989370 RepID=UPI001BA65739|nr:ABC transporter substrate-binding protein [Bradyrhizobium manausense]MBR0724127.1 ABC transporter substrate-binding protein [Bradyrhizobium manausense]